LSEFEDLLGEMARRRLGAQGITGLRRVTAGATQEVWSFSLDGGDGSKLILRRAPGGTRVSETALGLDTEAALLEAAAQANVPVPGVRHVLTPDDGLGFGFIMDFVEGETLGGRIVKHESFAKARETLAYECGQVLAKVHTMDPAAFPKLKRQDPVDLVVQWRTAYEGSGWPRPVFDLTFRWLAEHCPPTPPHPRFVHGDFRNGNLMIGPDGVRAVLDWELAHVGDPMEDLGWICVNSWRFGQVDKPVGGFGQREDLWAGYEAAGGAPVNRAHAKWWEVFGAMRWGVMCAGMTASFRGGDPSVERGVIARRTSESEIDLLRLLAS
jgi:aminoglycoside phosphotransferase (APT) family kinase protein